MIKDIGRKHLQPPPLCNICPAEKRPCFPLLSGGRLSSLVFPLLSGGRLFSLVFPLLSGAGLLYCRMLKPAEYVSFGIGRFTSPYMKSTCLYWVIVLQDVNSGLFYCCLRMPSHQITAFDHFSPFDFLSASLLAVLLVSPFRQQAS